MEREVFKTTLNYKLQMLCSRIISFQKYEEKPKYLKPYLFNENFREMVNFILKNLRKFHLNKTDVDHDGEKFCFEQSFEKWSSSFKEKSTFSEKRKILEIQYLIFCLKKEIPLENKTEEFSSSDYVFEQLMESIFYFENIADERHRNHFEKGYVLSIEEEFETILNCFNARDLKNLVNKNKEDMESIHRFLQFCKQ